MNEPSTSRQTKLHSKKLQFNANYPKWDVFVEIMLLLRFSSKCCTTDCGSRMMNGTVLPGLISDPHFEFSFSFSRHRLHFNMRGKRGPNIRVPTLFQQRPKEFHLQYDVSTVFYWRSETTDVCLDRVSVLCMSSCSKWNLWTRIQSGAGTLSCVRKR